MCPLMKGIFNNRPPLLLQNDKPLNVGMPQLIIQTHVSKKGWVAVYQGNTTGETWSYQKKTKYINALVLLVVNLAILTFTRGKLVTAIHLHIENMAAVLLV